jgi:hypothetical protein
MAQKVIVPQKKIMSRSFLNSGTLIVILIGQIRILRIFIVAIGQVFSLICSTSTG